MTWHQHERAALIDALTAAGPHAPTLCEGWQARHLAAHVLLRERSVRVGAGLAVPALAGAADRAISSLADTAQDDQGFAALVARVAADPPAWSPVTWAGDAANLVELFVHTEDVRRGAGDTAPRELGADLSGALWGRLLQTARLSYRRSPVGIVLVVPGGPRRVVRRAPRGHGTVAIRGEVGELVLHAFGRGAAAHVELVGDPQDVADLREVLPGG